MEKVRFMANLKAKISILSALPRNFLRNLVGRSSGGFRSGCAGAFLSRGHHLVGMSIGLLIDGGFFGHIVRAR